jgi:uncharacterized protein
LNANDLRPNKLPTINYQLDMDALIIFVRNAVLGKVKTRLAASIGDEMALRVYQKLLAHTRETCAQVDGQRLVYYSDHIDPEDSWGAGLFKKRVQSGADLGARMGNAFQTCFNQEKSTKALIIGSDCPDLTPKLLTQAFEALDQSDLVIGPALDGGYYLLGLRAYHAELFENMQWSTDQVASETIARAEKVNLKIHQLPVLRDVDELADLQAVGWW